MRASGRTLIVSELIEELGTSHLPVTASVAMRVEESTEVLPMLSVEAVGGELVFEVEDPTAHTREVLDSLVRYVEDLSNKRTAGGYPTSEAKRAQAVLDGTDFSELD